MTVPAVPWAEEGEAKLARLRFTAVSPERTLFTTMTVSAPSDEQLYSVTAVCVPG